MGDQLVKLYKQVESTWGKIELYRLIVKTRISPEMARKIPDSEENLRLVQKALDELGLELRAASQVEKRRGRIARFLRRFKK